MTRLSIFVENVPPSNSTTSQPGKFGSMLQTTDRGYASVGSQEHIRTEPEKSTDSPAPRPSILQVLKDWAPEVTWSILSIVFVVVIVIVLQRSDGHALKDLPLVEGVTLNTIIAFLATVCRAASVIPVTEGVSQLKWNWFAKTGRPLKDLEVFDQASRGPWGSLRMMVAVRGRVLGTTAAVILVSGLASSTLTQSSVAYSTRMVLAPGVSPAVHALNSFPPGFSDNSYDTVITEKNLLRKAYQAVFSDPAQVWPDLHPTCQSGNCTWPLFDSLSMCVSMQNVTEHINVSVTDIPDITRSYFASLPDRGGYIAENMSEVAVGLLTNVMNLVSPDPQGEGTLYRESLAFRGDDRLNATLSQFFIMYVNPAASTKDAHHRYRAMEVLWHFCVNTYNVTVVEGVDKTEIVDSQTRFDNNRTAPMYYTLYGRDDAEFKINTMIPLHEEIDTSFRFAFQERYPPPDPTNSRGPDRNGGFHVINELGQRLFMGANSSLSVEEFDKRVTDNVGFVTENIARSMSNYLRENDGEQKGQAYTPETFIHVRWEWIAFIACQIFLSVAFLVAVMVYTARLGMPVVKSSNLAELFALSAVDGAEQKGGLKTPVDGGVNGRLRRGEGGWAFELQGRKGDIQMDDLGRGVRQGMA